MSSPSAPPKIQTDSRDLRPAIIARYPHEFDLLNLSPQAVSSLAENDHQ
jgi:hypothetical protein